MQRPHPVRPQDGSVKFGVRRDRKVVDVIAA